jgi:ribosomal protein S12 methylthiotransferase
MKKIYLNTFGCSKNVADSEILLHQIKLNGFELVEKADEADIVLINTCGFIQDAKEESLEYIFELIKLKKAGIIEKICVFGCLSERYMSELKIGIPEVDLFFGTYSTFDIIRTLGGKPKIKELHKHRLITPPHYSYIKISDGCNHKCSFCAIPSFKGKYRSKKINEILKEIKNLPSTVKEINLVAQDTTFYGKDIYKKYDLVWLLNKINRLSFKGWVRLLYTYPTHFKKDILNIMLDSDKICNYLDIPIQHISDVVLKSMKRGDTRKKILDLIDYVRTKAPNIALRTSVIVGYPTERKKEFDELVSFIEEVKFDRLGIFTYSAEEGTTAFKLTDSVSLKEKHSRKEIIFELQKDISYNNNLKYVGKNMKVLIEDEDSSFFFGRTEFDAPEIDNLVVISKKAGADKKCGDFAEVKIIDNSDFDLYATFL